MGRLKTLSRGEGAQPGRLIGCVAVVFNNPFDVGGYWYKGNIHTHTKNSDGDLSPEDMARQYREHGYDFLCITDHGKVTDVENLSDPSFLVMNGEEITPGRTGLGEPYHLVAVNLRETIPEILGDAQEAIDLIRSKGAEAVLCHPYWSALTLSDMLPLERYLGIEVFNTTCFLSIAKGHSTVHWDELLAAGKRVWGFAVDDAHWHFNEHRPNDACGAWIMVKAPSLCIEEVLRSIKDGLFYSSNGPSIEGITVDDGRIRVRTSPAKIINFIADSSKGESFTAQGGRILREAEYTLRGTEKYIRVECLDAEARTAWSNPIFI